MASSTQNSHFSGMSIKLAPACCPSKHETDRLPSQLGFDLQPRCVVSSSLLDSKAHCWESSQLTCGPASTGSTVCLGS